MVVTTSTVVPVVKYAFNVVTTFQQERILFFIYVRVTLLIYVDRIYLVFIYIYIQRERERSSCVVFGMRFFFYLCLVSSLYKYRYDRGEMSLRVTKIIPGTNDHVLICLIFSTKRGSTTSLSRVSVAVLLEGTKARQLRPTSAKLLPRTTM